MSYIAFDLDALNRAPAAARSAGVREEDIIAGLVRLWAWCFREKVARVDADQVRGHFGADVTRALVAFGFLEADADGWRVKGAERYLRITEARSEGGKKASGNLKKGTKKAPRQPEVQPGTLPGSLPAPAGDQPGTAPGSAPALTPTTDDLAPSTESKRRTSTNEHQATIDSLTAAYAVSTGAKYPFTGRDAVVVGRLLKATTRDVIEAAWARALAHRGWPTVRTLAELEKNLAHFVGAAPPGGSAKPVPPSTEFTNSISEGF